MSTRFRIPLCLAAAVCAAVVALVGVLRLVAPGGLGPFGDLPPGLVGVLGGPVLESALGLAGVLGVFALLVLARATRANAASVLGRRALRVASVPVALLLAVTTPGGMIPVAGYAFALSVLGGLVALAMLLVLRRPLVGGGMLAVLAGVVVWAGLRFDGGELLVRILASFGPQVPTALVALAHLGAAAALLVWAILDARVGGGSVAGWVLRHRGAITIVAALCAAPYVLARASWLTPWPLFGGSAELFAAEPMVQLTGLILGLGMLTGGMLTLGLVLPWGRRFPQWMAGLGGRAVPLMLVVVPAVLVALLFTVGGVEFLVAMAVQPEFSGNVFEMTLMLPFWLWGPLLALAAWGYALDRSGAQAAAPIQRSVRTRQPRVARRASR